MGIQKMNWSLQRHLGLNISVCAKKEKYLHKWIL